MSSILQTKIDVFERIWSEFQTIKDALILAGVKETSFTEKEKLEAQLAEWHINKLRDSEQWLKSFINVKIKAWRKIRSENSEEYWNLAKALNYGEDYQEIRELNKASKEVRAAWINNHNILLKRKKNKVKEEIKCA